ncbi:MAG: glycosyltransferase family 2 protein [Candidatus Bathyarchaeia archaeon]|jgi:glycosyltransferase involved in cell wall biosynthesis
MKTNTEPPRVSVIIPTKNSAKTLNKCLQSINSQTFRQFEVIVVDAFSNDQTPNIAEKNQAKLMQTKGFQSKARNIGVKNSTGEFVLFLDSDQSLSKTVIEDCLNLCSKNVVGMVRVPEVFVGNSFWSNCSAVWRNNYDKVEALYGDHLGLVHGKPRFFSRVDLELVGLFDESLLWGEDYDLYMRLKLQGVKEAVCSSVLYHFEAVSLRQFLLKNLRYGDSMSAFRQRSSGQGFSVMINHSVLTFIEILKKPVRLTEFLGCAVLFFIKSSATVLGALKGL